MLPTEDSKTNIVKGKKADTITINVLGNSCSLLMWEIKVPFQYMIHYSRILTQHIFFVLSTKDSKANLYWQKANTNNAKVPIHDSLLKNFDPEFNSFGAIYWR